jgi:predicted PurR-regulated permease PerM
VLVGVFVGLNNILIANIRQFLFSSDSYIQALTIQIQNLIQYAHEKNINIGLDQIFSQLDIKGIFQFSLSVVLKLASSTLFILLFVGFILAERDLVNEKIEELSRRNNMRSGIRSVVRNINRQIEHYIVWKTVISLLTGLTSLIVFYFFGLEAAFLWAFIIFVFNYIPAIGSIVASIFPILITYLQFGSLSTAALMALCMLGIQVAYGNVIEPRLMGNKLNLSPLVVLLSLLLWNKIWGVIGMFLAIPIMATLNIIMANIPALSHISLLISNKPKRKTVRDS